VLIKIIMIVVIFAAFCSVPVLFCRQDYRDIANRNFKKARFRSKFWITERGPKETVSRWYSGIRLSPNDAPPPWAIGRMGVVNYRKFRIMQEGGAEKATIS
jgi:hypothetical protein